MQVGGGADKIIAAWHIPAGSRINGLWLEHSIQAMTRTPLDVSLFYGVTGYVIPLSDPDSVITPDTLWDAKVQKDTPVGSGVLDMDTSASDTSPEFELGDIDVSDFLDIKTTARELFTRRHMITFPKAPLGFHLDPETPFTDMFYVPTDYYKTRVRKGAFVENHSFLLLGVSQPDYAGTLTTWPDFSSTAAWHQIQYLTETMRDMWKSVTAAIVSGTQEASFEAATLIAAFFEHFHEESGAAFGGASFTLRNYVKATLDLTVEGEYSDISMGSPL